MFLPASLSLDVSSIHPRLTLDFLSRDNSSYFNVPAFVCGNSPVSSNINSLICSTYSAVVEQLYLLNHSLNSGYFCSGLSPVTINASVHFRRLPNLAMFRTCSFVKIDKSKSDNSFL